MTRRQRENSKRDRTIWVRREPRDGEALIAGAVAVAAGAAVGGAALYLARMFLARDVLVLDSVPEQESSSG